VSTDTLGDAVTNPIDYYYWFLVRVSGYNAYFTKLNKNILNGMNINLDKPNERYFFYSFYLTF